MIALNTVVRNEAHRIVNCLERAAVYCDELVVVDQHSDDGTAELAEGFGARVILDFEYGFCEPSRPVAAEHTESDWIIVLDADEHLVPERIPSLAGIMADFAGAKLSVASYVDGVRTDPMVNGMPHWNRQFRFFRRGTVQYGMTLHSRITTLCPGSVFVSEGEVWISNTKARWELELDEERYRLLKEGVRCLPTG